jgi:hypothetical protein
MALHERRAEEQFRAIERRKNFIFLKSSEHEHGAVVCVRVRAMTSRESDEEEKKLRQVHQHNHAA